MFVKLKWKFWLILIVVCFIISKVPPCIIQYNEKKASEEEAAKVYSTCVIDIRQNNPALKNRISGEMIHINGTNVKVISSSENPDIIISEKKDSLDGYDELEDFLYVPYIMVANPNLIGTSQTCFNPVNNDKEKFSKDIRYILEAMEEGKKWKDIGIDNDNVIGNKKDNVTLMIPTRYTNEYQKIKNYCIYALNNYSKPKNEDEYAILLARVNNILNQCIEVENIEAEFTQSSWFEGIILCKESIISEMPKYFTRKKCVVIAPTTTIKDTYQVYVKKEKADELKDILKDYSFLELTGFRNKEYNEISNSSYYKRSFEVFDCIEVNNISEIYQKVMPATIATKSNAEETTKETTEETIKETAIETKESTEETETTEESSENESIEENEETDDEITFGDIVFAIVVIALIILVVIALISILMI